MVLNAGREGECRRRDGRAFHCTGPVLENALPPKDFVFVEGTARIRLSVEERSSLFGL